ncbi:MAG: Uma2 family endonuclease [Gemmataceae bacterium]|nr:Uma2 family endonuclease [Gemmataceae bacterium]
MIQKADSNGLTGTTVVSGEQVVSIPPWVHDLETFRRWFVSDEFPKRGHIFYLCGEIWVDLSMEQLWYHNQVKGEFYGVLGGLAKAGKLGRFFPDGLRLINIAADLSCEPDGTFVMTSTLLTGRARAVEDKLGSCLELEGTPDMVLEIISPSSVRKDTQTLHDLYWQAGIPEYWLVDARGETLQFDIFHHGAKGYAATRRQGGWLKSKVFGKSFRLVRQSDALRHPEYTLEVR